MSKNGSGARARLVGADFLFQFGNSCVSRCLLRGCANGGGKEGGEFGACGAGGGEFGGGGADDVGKCFHSSGGLGWLNAHKVVNNGGGGLLAHTLINAGNIGINGGFAAGGADCVHTPKVFQKSGVGGHFIGFHSSKFLVVVWGACVIPFVLCR